MEIIYKAFDGTDFSNEQECLEYESKTNGLKMWGYNGKETDKVENAIYVYIDPLTELNMFYTYGEINIVAQLFIKKCKEKEVSYKGICEFDSGLFYWDDDNEIFLRLDFDTVKILSNIVDKIGEK